jgi:hypothetical protein
MDEDPILEPWHSPSIEISKKKAAFHIAGIP